MMKSEHSLEEENYEFNKTAPPSKKSKIISTRIPENLALSPASRAALRIQKKILSAISDEEIKKSKARKKKVNALKKVNEKVFNYF